MVIYLIEDDAIYAEYIQRSLNKNPEFKVTHFASAEACESSLNGGADAFIIDYKLPGKTGIDFFEGIKPTINDDSKVILMSAIDDGNMVLSFIQKGIRDYVIKDDSVVESLTAILEGKEDEYYLFS